jgi:hypothetical protein
MQGSGGNLFFLLDTPTVGMANQPTGCFQTAWQHLFMYLSFLNKYAIHVENPIHN